MESLHPRTDSRADAPPGIGTSVRTLLGLAIVLAAMLSLVHAALLVSHASRLGGTSALAIALGALLGIPGADLLTGFIHWACDTWGDEDARWLGPALIHSFREHHRDPQGMVEHDWIEVNGEACAAAAAFFGVSMIPGVVDALLAHPSLYAFAWSLSSFAAGANQLHQWAHMRRPPWIVARIQSTGLILSLERHARHHRAPHTNGYCISIGWLNPMLDALGFWRGLERCVNVATGAKPRSKTGAPRSRGPERPREQESTT